MGLDRQDVTYTGGQSQHGVSILCPESPGMTPSRGSPEQMAQAVSHRAVWSGFMGKAEACRHLWKQGEGASAALG